MSQPSRLTGKTQIIRMLVAEDDSFQRLALIDILTLCNYDVVAVENGRVARDELLKEDSNFDLVLLDVNMPEMGGLELLLLMQSNDNLKDIPVIMMSAEGEQEIVSQCLRSGAKNYLIKPIRIQSVKNLASHIDPSKKNKTVNPLNLTLEQYETIKLVTFYYKINFLKLTEKKLGRGAAGSVNLVRRTTDGEYFALKIIQMSFMSPQERKMAENEITLLKVLVGPTIIRYYDSFIENDSIHIVMEYAEGGSLSEKITDHKNRGVPISNEQILYWTAQLVLGIMLMHSKNILHRDIKTQNMFLAKKDVVKLGDFGISKALGTQKAFANTFLGTPYFMSPEVCNGKEYGQKSDIWAIGCAIYEMATLRRPFNHESLSGMFEMIINKDYDPLPSETSTEVKMLIHEMLQKDYTQRPTIFEIANKQCIRDKINKFVVENDCKESVEAYFSVDSLRKDNGATKGSISSPATQPVEKPSPGSASTKSESMSKCEEESKRYEGTMKNNNSSAPGFFTMEKLEEFSRSIRDTIDFKEIKKGYFSKLNKAVSGADIYDWASKNLSTSDDNYKKRLCQDLIDHHFIYAVNEADEFSNENDSFYIFQCDRPKIAINMHKLWYKEVRKPLFVSCELLKQLNIILKEIRQEGGGEVELNNDFPKTSKSYQRFLDAICELQRVDLKVMDKQEQTAFFLNIYQVMKTHWLMYNEIMATDPTYFKNQKGWFETVMSYIPYLGSNVDSEFFYNINDLNFTLDEIRDGILRGNKKSSSFRGYTNKDPKFNFVQRKDPRFLCVIGDENAIPKKLEEFWKDNFSDKLENICKEFLSLSVYYNPVDSELILPKSFEKFKDDLGKTSFEMVSWVLKYIKNINRNEIINGIRNNTIEISYPDN